MGKSPLAKMELSHEQCSREISTVVLEEGADLTKHRKHEERPMLVSALIPVLTPFYCSADGLRKRDCSSQI